MAATPPLEQKHVLVIESEDPIADQWQRLSHYQYPTNIRRHIVARGLPEADQSTIEFVAGCFSQAQAYFSSSRSSPLDISPLLLYYGATLLASGTAAILGAAIPPIDRHGLRLELPQDSSHIGDVKLMPQATQRGALHQFAAVFSRGDRVPGGASWPLSEVLLSLPDLRRECLDCYPAGVTHTIPVEVKNVGARTFERVATRHFYGHADPMLALLAAPGFSHAYITPQYSQDREWIVLHRRINGAEIGCYSIFGQKHIQLPHIKSGTSTCPSQIVLMVMGLYALGFLSRYHPQVWSPFLRTDQTGERLLIESFLLVSHRYFPTLILSELYGARLQFRKDGPS